MKSKTTYVYYATKAKNLIGAYGYFGASQMKTKHAYGYFGQTNKKVPRWGYFYFTSVRLLLFCPDGDTFILKISEYIFRSNLRNRKSQRR